MSERSDDETADLRVDAGVDGEDVDLGPDPVLELVARAREACVGHPELLEVVERIDRLDEIDLARRPEVLDAAHRTLREVLTGAGRSGSTP